MSAEQREKLLIEALQEIYQAAENAWDGKSGTDMHNFFEHLSGVVIRTLAAIDEKPGL